MATKQQVERKLRELTKRLADSGRDVQGSLADTLPDSRTIEVALPDLGTSYWTEMAEGRMGPLQRGAPERADIRLIVDSDHLVELIDGRKSLFSSYLAGHIKVQASISDLLALRRLM